MTIPDLAIDLASDVPVYRQIADGVRDAATDGRLKPGHRLPPTRDLARTLGVNRNTVIAAYDALTSEGWVRSHTGRGTFIVARPDGRTDEAEGEETWFTAFSRTVESGASAGLHQLYNLVLDPSGISFAGSYPAGEWMPVDRFRDATDRALERGGPALLAYGPTAGHPALRETIAARMNRRGAKVRGEQILITNGAQQALELVFRTMLEPGDAVVIEEPTYTGALSVLAALGARVVGVPLDREGIRPDLLQIALERHRPRLIYLQPSFQNPTTAVMSDTRRREVLELARRHRCPIVEDDWAGDLHFDGDDPSTLHAMDAGRHVIYLSTFSKKLMPGLRLGWVAAPARVFDRILELKRIQDCGSSPLLQAALDEFLRDGGLDDHLGRVRPLYRERRDRMIAALEREFPDEARWDRPAGGLFLWVRLPSSIDGRELFAAARQRGVLFSSGEFFHSDGSGRNELRLTFSAVSPEQIDEGIATLGRLIDEQMRKGEAEVGSVAGESVPIF